MAHSNYISLSVKVQPPRQGPCDWFGYTAAKFNLVGKEPDLVLVALFQAQSEHCSERMVDSAPSVTMRSLKGRDVWEEPNVY